MALRFTEQLDSADRALEGTGRLALCLGSGISRRKLPLLAQLIASAFRNLPHTAQADQLFLAVSRGQVFHLRLADMGITTAQPCTLDEFRGLADAVQADICNELINTYGDVFRDVESVYGSKRELLEAIDIEQFERAVPDVSHFYIAYLLIEGNISRVLTTNWDRLIEKAVAVSTSKPTNDFLTVAKDDATWLQRGERNTAVLAKVHGCATQYPTQCEQIVITTPELQVAAANGWRQDAVTEFLSGPTLFSGYSGSDYTLMVPTKVIDVLRKANALPAARYFVAEDKDLTAGALQLSGDRPDHHLRMYANDTFTSLYFAALRTRFKQAVELAGQQTRPERAFTRWSDAEWDELVRRLHHLLEVDLPSLLDDAIGLPGLRTYDESVGTIPVRLSELREMFIEGRVQHPNLYRPFRFDRIKDLVLLTLIAAFVELKAGRALSLSLNNEIAGLNFIESTGAVRTVCFVYGTYAPAVVPMVTSYLNDLEASLGPLPSFEVLIIPCSEYKVGTIPSFAPRPVLAKHLPGIATAIRTFVNPDVIFGASDFADLISRLRSELGV
ncbi:SIR2 family protein [Tunturiibacter gelidoferens]|uniref:SIR2 family protein n=1 Tax=Tunturiibacter gelidiferens TaxID=3069689 RepID=A0AAU7YU91_9BACT